MRLVWMHVAFQVLYMHVLAGKEEHSTAAQDAVAHPGIPRQDTYMAQADVDNAQADTDIAGDASAGLFAAQHEQQCSQLEAPDGREHKQPEESVEQQPAQARKGTTAGTYCTVHANAEADREMPDAEQADRLPDMAESATSGELSALLFSGAISSGSSPLCCMRLDTLPALGVSCMPSDAAAGAEASPAGNKTPVNPADQAEEQPVGSDLHGAQGQDESAKQSELQGSHATINSDDEQLDVQNTEKLLATVPLEQLSKEQVSTPPGGADATGDGAAGSAQHVAVPGQQITVHFYTPDTVDVPCGAAVSQVTACLALEDVTPGACQNGACETTGSEQHDRQQQHEQQGTGPRQGMPHALSSPHAAAQTPSGAADKHAPPTTRPSLPAAAASNGAGVAPPVVPQGARTLAACEKGSAGSFSFPKPLEPEAPAEPAQVPSTHYSRLPAQDSTKLTPSNGQTVSGQTVRLAKRPPGIILPQPAKKRQNSPVTQPGLFQSSSSPAEPAGPATTNQVAPILATDAAALAARPPPTTQGPKQGEVRHPATPLQQGIAHLPVKAVAIRLPLASLPADSASGRLLSQGCRAGLGLTALTDKLNKLPQIICSTTPPQQRLPRQAALCKTPPTRITPLLTRGAGRLGPGSSSGSTGAKMPASSVRATGSDVLLTAGGGNGNAPASMASAEQRRALPHQALQLPASHSALQQQEGTLMDNPTLQQQSPLQVSTAPQLSVYKWL